MSIEPINPLLEVSPRNMEETLRGGYFLRKKKAPCLGLSSFLGGNPQYGLVDGFMGIKGSENMLAITEGLHSLEQRP